MEWQTDDAKIDASKAGNVTSQLERPHNVIILLGGNDGRIGRESGGENSMFVLSDAECILMGVERERSRRHEACCCPKFDDRPCPDGTERNGE